METIRSGDKAFEDSDFCPQIPYGPRFLHLDCGFVGVGLSGSQTEWARPLPCNFKARAEVLSQDLHQPVREDPPKIAQDLRWSVPAEYLVNSPAALSQTREQPKVLLNYFSFTEDFRPILENTLALDPRLRSRASDLAEALDPVERTLTMGAV